MATKKAVNGKHLEFIVIRPQYGFTVNQIADGILIDGQFENVDQVKKKLTSWSKVQRLFNKNLLEYGMISMDYAWEKINHYTSYEKLHPQVVSYLKTLNERIS